MVSSPALFFLSRPIPPLCSWISFSSFVLSLQLLSIPVLFVYFLSLHQEPSSRMCMSVTVVSLSFIHSFCRSVNSGSQRQWTVMPCRRGTQSHFFKVLLSFCENEKNSRHYSESCYIPTPIHLFTCYLASCTLT